MTVVIPDASGRPAAGGAAEERYEDTRHTDGMGDPPMNWASAPTGVDNGEATSAITIDPEYERRPDGFVARYVLQAPGNEPIDLAFAVPLQFEDPEEVGFQPDSEPDGWEVVDGEILVRHQLVDGRDEVVLGIVADEDSPPEELLGDPEILPGGTAQSAPGAIDAGESAHDASTMSDAAASSDTSSWPPDGAIQPDADEPSSGTADAPGESSKEPEFDELAGGSIDEATLDMLREAIGDAESRSLRVRVNHLEGRLEKFDAYSDMLGTFVDAYGTPSEHADAVDDRCVALEERLASLERDIDRLETTLADVREQASEDAARIEESEARIQDLAGDIENLAGPVKRFERLEAALGDALPVTEPEVDS